MSLDGDVSVTVLRTGETDAAITPKVNLSKEGVDLVKKTAKKSLDTCLAAKVSNPPNCPWEFSEDGLTVTKNSVSYSLKNDPWGTSNPDSCRTTCRHREDPAEVRGDSGGDLQGDHGPGRAGLRHRHLPQGGPRVRQTHRHLV